MVRTNATGDKKLKPLVVGTAKSPRCFRGRDKSLLPVFWRNNKKAWMNSRLWVEWLRDCFYPEVKAYIQAQGIRNPKVRWRPLQRVHSPFSWCVGAPPLPDLKHLCDPLSRCPLYVICGWPPSRSFLWWTTALATARKSSGWGSCPTGLR